MNTYINQIVKFSIIINIKIGYKNRQIFHEMWDNKICR